MARHELPTTHHHSHASDHAARAESILAAERVAVLSAGQRDSTRMSRMAGLRTEDQRKTPACALLLDAVSCLQPRHPDTARTQVKSKVNKPA